jgi:arylsulfatase A-like enzyme
MPCQHGVHCFLAAGGAQIGPGAYNTVGEFPSISSVLADAGYAAGLCGKWHLGGNLNPQSGFTYWVTKPHGNSLGFYDQDVIENGRIRKEPGYLTDFWTDHAVRFMEQNRDRPFFLYLAYNGPYGLSGAAKEPIRNRHAAFYADQELPSMPRDSPHPWLHNHRDWMRDAQVRRKYAAEISGIDDGVGRVLETLRRLGLERDTLVVFTADQGLACGHSGFWGMGDHTRPLTAFDWTMSIPLIFRHPGRIPAGKRCDALVGTYDLAPSILRYLGHELRGSLPGRDMNPLFEGRSVEWDNTVFFEFENVRAIRTARYKYIERIHQAPNELYDLDRDPGERLNLVDNPEMAPTRAELRRRLHAFFSRHADPKWDLWRGGKSKSHLLTSGLFKR